MIAPLATRLPGRFDDDRDNDRDNDCSIRIGTTIETTMTGAIDRDQAPSPYCCLHEMEAAPPGYLCPDRCPDRRRSSSSSRSLSRSSSIRGLFARSGARFINRKSPANPGSAFLLAVSCSADGGGPPSLPSEHNGIEGKQGRAGSMPRHSKRSATAGPLPAESACRSQRKRPW